MRRPKLCAMGTIHVLVRRGLPGPRTFDAAPVSETVVARKLEAYAATCNANDPSLCNLSPSDFVSRVLCGGVSVDDGDWVQPLFFQCGEGIWLLRGFEVLYRMSDARCVPYPAFVDFVYAATDQAQNMDGSLRRAFQEHTTSSLRRVDARLTTLGKQCLEDMLRAGLLTAVNATAKQLPAILEVPLRNEKLLAIEETEYDTAPADLTELRLRVWRRFGALSLDDVKPALSDFGGVRFSPPLTPAGAPFKALAETTQHDLRFARRFIDDFRLARRADPKARGDIKLDEEFCCYLLGVGHAPFARESMRAWRRLHPAASERIRSSGAALISEAVAAGLGVCFEVSFADGDVRWLTSLVPSLGEHLCKQGGQSGSAALPHSMVAQALGAPQ
mmetsp:Transcript_40093/g.115227  ORF Transcript_40093/g.115227 Transcript_40093/m.115227 type:complete len:388 (-) Transcript_40093:135-1298(-)